MDSMNLAVPAAAPRGRRATRVSRAQLLAARVRTAICVAAGAVVGVAAITVAACSTVQAQWVTTYDQHYMAASHNWEFRNRYAFADRLFNAFDFGHAILYETLLRRPEGPARVLEEEIYDRLTQEILVRPPRLPVAESAVEVRYARLAPEAKAMFDWAHKLHRQAYDVLADPRLNDAERDREMDRLLAYYGSRPDLAFSLHPKSMALMQEQSYSLAFRLQYPKFNGLIWAYHWLQVGLYEPLLVGGSAEERQALVRSTVARFWQMLGDAPQTMPHQMPMTASVAPQFAARYPELAIIFDNLHSMHDVISDILANPAVPAHRKREEIQLAAARYRDDTSFVMSRAAWLTMSREMGIENQGGPAVGFALELPTPTVTYGAAMRHDDRTGRMTGMIHGRMLQEHEHEQDPGAEQEHDHDPEPERPHEHEHAPPGVPDE
jgi:hypothetical protein